MARKRPGHKGLSGEDDSPSDAYDVATPYAPPAVEYAPVQIPALDSLEPAAQDQVTSTIAAGIANGTNPNALVGALSDILNASQALTILRTEMLGAFRQSALDSYNANNDVIGSWMWVATLSPNTCIACLETDGEIFSLDENFDSHPNCFPAGTLVSGPRPIGSTTRWYVGEMVEIEIRGGHFLRVTPNHPILTRGGWVAAGLLEVGDDVISCRMAESGHPRASADPDNDDVPTPIEQVAVTLRGARAVRAVSVPATAEDFHGDGRGSINGEVHIVRAHGVLWDTGMGRQARRQPFAQQYLCRRHAQLALLARARSLHLFTNALLAPAHSGLGSLGIAPALFRGASGSQRAIDLQRAANSRASSAQTRANGLPRNAIGIRQRLLRLASDIARNNLRIRQARTSAASGTGMCDPQAFAGGSVTEQPALLERIAQALLPNVEPGADDLHTLAGRIGVDRVLKVRRRGFRGHVYNLQTTTGWYIANNIITHNCRCTPVPVTVPWSGILGPLGIDYSDLEATTITEQDFLSGQAWFLTQDVAIQREIIGPSAFNAWQAGEIQLSDLAERDAAGQLYQASLDQLGIDWRDFRDAQMIDLTEWNAQHADDNLLGLASRPGGGVEPMRRAFEELPNLDGVMAQLADRHEGLEAELAGLDTPVANQLASTFDMIAERWPEAAERVGYFGIDMGPGAERVLRGPQSLPWRMFAAADPNGRYVLLNAARFYDIEKVQAELAEDVATGFHPLGADNPMFPVAHEMGHVVDAWIRTDAERAALLDAWEAEHGALAGGLGRYVNAGDFVEHERFATAFAANELGILADDPYVRAQAEFLQQLIADHPGTGDAIAFPGKGSDLRPVEQGITRASLEQKNMAELREIARDVGADVG